MKNRVLLTVAAGALLLVAAPAATQAQWIWVGGGLTIPTSDYGDYAKTGWMGTVGVGFPIGDSGLGVSIEGLYGSNKHDTDVTGVVDGDKTNLYGAMGSVGYRVGDPANIGPYVFAGGGLLVHQFSPETGDSDSSSGFGYQFGAGLDIPVGSSVGVWVEGRYLGASIDSSTTAVFGILAGIGFGIG